MLITLLAIGLAIFFCIQTFESKRRIGVEDKVMKGYFLLGLSGLMAKIAMADGRVTGDEAEMANQVFRRMDLTDAERAICIGNFVTARKDGLTARDHAKRFTAYANTAACEFLYDILWRISMADGEFSSAEDGLLSEIVQDLGLGSQFYENYRIGKRPRFDKAVLKAAGVPPSLLTLVC